MENTLMQWQTKQKS